MNSNPVVRRGHCDDRLARLLNLRLKEALSLEAAATQAHTLVKRPNFIALHGLFGCEPAGRPGTQAFRRGLVERLRTLHRRLRSTATRASRLHEPGAAPACADRLHDVDKFRHLLESQLRLRH